MKVSSQPQAIVAAQRAARRVRAARWAVRPHVAFAAVVCGLATVRFVVLAMPGTPPGVDGGNWLAFGHALLGERLRDPSLVYPPVVPLLAVAANGLLGPVTGLSALAAASSIVPALGVYAVVSRSGLRWGAVALGALVAGASSVAEAAAWGGYPQLLATGAALLAVSWTDEWVRSGRRRGALASAALVTGVVATSHMVAFTLAAALLAVAIARLRQVGLARTVVRLGAACAPAALFVPLYVRLLGATLASRTGVPRIGIADTLSGGEFLFRDFATFWRSALVVAALTPLLFLHRRRDALWVAAFALWAGVVVPLVVTRDQRYLYLAQPFSAVALGVWVCELSERKSGTVKRMGSVLVAGLALAAVAQYVGAVPFFVGQRDYYGVLSPGLFAAVRDTSRLTSASAVVAVGPVRDAPFGWWVEGLARRRTIYASPLRWLTFPDERRRAKSANAVFAGRVPDLAAARRSGASHLLFPKLSSEPTQGGVDAALRAGSARISFENGDAILVRLP